MWRLDTNIQNSLFTHIFFKLGNWTCLLKTELISIQFNYLPKYSSVTISIRLKFEI
jgi:hypothetical protein